MNNAINVINEDIYHLKNGIINIKENKLNPKKFELKTQITEDSYINDTINNSFTVFNSINNVLYLIYSNKNKSIICHDLKNNKKLCEIKSYHNEYVSNLKHYLDNINKRDLIMSLSNKDSNIKLWNLYNWECILNISSIYKTGNLFSACLLNHKNKYYIITSNYKTQGDLESIKIYDIDRNETTEIKNSNDTTFIIDTYYDKIKEKIYIITGNKNDVKSYDFNNKELYHKYSDNDTNSHQSFEINEFNNEVNLFETSQGIIRIWDFHSNILLIFLDLNLIYKIFSSNFYYLIKIRVADNDLISLFFWNNEYLMAGCFDKTNKFINLKKRIAEEILTGHSNIVNCIKKIHHPDYGDCLVSHGWKVDQIKLWVYNNKK